MNDLMGSPLLARSLTPGAQAPLNRALPSVSGKSPVALREFVR